MVTTVQEVVEELVLQDVLVALDVDQVVHQVVLDVGHALDVALAVLVVVPEGVLRIALVVMDVVQDVQDALEAVVQDVLLALLNVEDVQNIVNIAAVELVETVPMHVMVV